MDTTYQDLFNSLGIATVVCTLIVSIGKLLSDYYIFYVFVISCIAIITTQYLHKRKQAVTPSRFKWKRAAVSLKTKSKAKQMFSQILQNTSKVQDTQCTSRTEDKHKRRFGKRSSSIHLPVRMQSLLKRRISRTMSAQSNNSLCKTTQV